MDRRGPMGGGSRTTSAGTADIARASGGGQHACRRRLRSQAPWPRAPPALHAVLLSPERWKVRARSEGFEVELARRRQPALSRETGSALPESLSGSRGGESSSNRSSLARPVWRAADQSGCPSRRRPRARVVDRAARTDRCRWGLGADEPQRRTEALLLRCRATTPAHHRAQDSHRAAGDSSSRARKPAKAPDRDRR